MTRKTKRDWLAAAVHAFAQKGPGGLTIDNLAKQLSVTKGSFYHHFENYKDFKLSFLQHYEEESTLSIIETLKSYDSASEKLHRLIAFIVEFSTQLDVNPENMLRAWAMHDETARIVQTRVDQQRIAYVELLLRELIPDEQKASAAAIMMYIILVGAEQMHPPIIGNDLLIQFNAFLRLNDIEQICDIKQVTS